LVAKGWGPELKVEGNADKNQWERVDIPREKTIEQLKEDGLSSTVYTLQETALLDPLRGLYEKPLEGVQGHHEFMLTTDMCMVYTRNTNVGRCFGSRNASKVDKEGKGLVGTIHANSC
jgi:hypothetical protein